MLVVAMAVLGSLTVLPAILSWLGDRVEKGRVPFGPESAPRRRRTVLERDPQSGPPASRNRDRPRGDAAHRPRAREPDDEARAAGPGDYPDSLPAVGTYKKLQAAFPGGEVPAEVVIRADDVTTPQMEEAIGQLEWRALVYAGMREPITTDQRPAHRRRRLDPGSRRRD